MGGLFGSPPPSDSSCLSFFCFHSGNGGKMICPDVDLFPGPPIAPQNPLQPFSKIPVVAGPWAAASGLSCSAFCPRLFPIPRDSPGESFVPNAAIKSRHARPPSFCDFLGLPRPAARIPIRPPQFGHNPQDNVTVPPLKASGRGGRGTLRPDAQKLFPHRGEVGSGEAVFCGQPRGNIQAPRQCAPRPNPARVLNPPRTVYWAGCRPPIGEA